MRTSTTVLRRHRKFTVPMTLLLAAAAIAAPEAAQASTSTSAQTPAQRVVSELSAVPNLLTATPAAAGRTPVAQGASIQMTGSAGAATQVASGLTVTPNALPHIDAAVKTDSTGVSHIVVLKDAAAATNVTFTVTEAGHKLVADQLGGVMLVGANGKFDGRISAPWAYDAKGRSLPTSFSVNGNTVTQHINTQGAAFPVVADPHYTWGWVSGTVYFNKVETANLAVNAGFAAALGAFAPPPFNLLLAGYAAGLAYVAAIAVNNGDCVDLNSYGHIGQYWGSQGDGYCQ